MASAMKHQTGPKWLRWLDATATIVVIAAAAVVVYTTLNRDVPDDRRIPAEPAVPSKPQAFLGREVLGAQTAPIGLIVYSEFGCRFCARFSTETLPRLIDKYVRTGELAIAFRHFPPTQRQTSFLGAMASECAARQGKFWPVHDWLFDRFGTWTQDDLMAAAPGLGVDHAAFSSCISGEIQKPLLLDVASGRAIQITGTPTFLVGPLKDGNLMAVERFAGARDLDYFQEVIRSVQSKVTESPGK